MNPFDFFARKVCLTNNPAEWDIGVQEFARVGLDVQRFNALPDIGPHQSFNKSTRQILIDFNESDDQTLLFLEDDCVFRELGHLELALSELPSDWDIVYLGANLICWNNGEPWPMRYSEHLFRIKVAWTTHAVGYNKRVIPFILDHQPPFSEIMFDNWLSNCLPQLKAYVVAPMVAYQRARFSSIWQRHDDYTPIFEASEERLK